MSLNLDKELLNEVFKTISSEVQVLEPIRDSANRIVDFRYVLDRSLAYGKNREDLQGKTVATVFPWKKERGIIDDFIKVVERNEKLDTTVELGESGHTRWYQLKAKKFNDGLIVYREDVTTEKQAEEKIMQLNSALFNKNRELEALSSELKTFNTIAAHDYNDTLRGLYNSMEFIITNDAKNLSDAGKANIRRAQAAIQKMKLLTEDIIAFSRIHSEQEMTSVELSDVILSVLSSLDEKIKEEDAIVRVDKLPAITGYPALLSLLFYHLITNALKFRKPDLQPVIDIKHSVQQGSQIQHSAALKDVTYNMISVIDNGLGFPPEEGEKIFTMFYRLHEKGKHKGSGIGLAICKKVMDLHGGFIASECTPECTTFRCYFPVQKNL